MTSHLEILGPDGWIGVKTLNPGETSTFTNYLPDKQEELYIYSCAEDDSSTNVQRKTNPRQVRLSRTETFVPFSYPNEHIALLKNGEEYRLPIITQGGNAVDVRVIHRQQ